MAPMTVGNFVCIVLTFLYGTMFIKFGVKKSLIPTMILCAVGCIGVAAANGLACNGGEGNYVLYFISLFITRCTCMMLQMAGFQLVASWFVRFRGQIMGVITVGSPLFSVVGTAGMTTLITKKLGGDYRPFYIAIAVLLVIVAVVVGFAIKDTPEEAGLYPDGANHPLKSESEGEEVKLTIKDILSTKKDGRLSSLSEHLHLSSMPAWAPWLCVISHWVVASLQSGYRQLNTCQSELFSEFRCLMYLV